MAEEKGIVAQPVDEVSREQRDGDEDDAVDRLQVAPGGHVEEQRRGGPDEGVEIVAGFGDDLRGDAEEAQQRQGAEGEQHDGGGAEQDEPEGLCEQMDGFFAAFGIVSAVGLGGEGFKAGEEADGAEDDGVVNGVAERGRGDGERGVREAADHHGVDEVGGHPSKLAEGKGKAEQGSALQLCAETLITLSRA